MTGTEGRGEVGRASETRELGRDRSVLEMVCDGVLVLVVFSPLVVCVWSSTWHILDLYIFSNHLTDSGWVSLGLGLALYIVSFFTQDLLNQHVRADTHFVRYVVVSRFFTYTMTVAVVNNWRGVWTLLDEYTDESILNGGINYAVGVIGLVSMRSFRNALSSPGSWELDLNTQTHFTVLTRFRTQKSSVLYVLDVLFGVLVLSTLVVLVWRGHWICIEFALHHLSLAWRGGVATIVASTLLVILVAVQYPAMRLSDKLHHTSPFRQVVFEDAFLLVVTAMSITYWFGIWELLDVAFHGMDQYSVQWMLHVLGFGGLMVFRVSSSLHFQGYFIDGEFPGGLGLLQTPAYCRTFISASPAARQPLGEAIYKAGNGSKYVDVKVEGEGQKEEKV